MIAFMKRFPVDEPCQCCQTDEPDDWEVEITGVPESEDDRVGSKRWAEVVTIALLVVAAVVFLLSGLAMVPNPWAWVWFLFGGSSCSLAGLVAGVWLAGD